MAGKGREGSVWCTVRQLLPLKHPGGIQRSLLSPAAALVQPCAYERGSYQRTQSKLLSQSTCPAHEVTELRPKCR